jgi:hypothetical protein
MTYKVHLDGSSKAGCVAQSVCCMDSSEARLERIHAQIGEHRQRSSFERSLPDPEARRILTQDIHWATYAPAGASANMRKVSFQLL